MAMLNMKFVVILCAFVINSAQSRAPAPRGSVTSTMTDVILTDSTTNLCFILGSVSRSCKINTPASSQTLRKHPTPTPAIPITFTFTNSQFTRSVMNICIINGNSSNTCAFGPPASGLRSVPAPVATSTSTTFIGSVINLFVSDQGSSYSCAITGKPGDLCTVLSESSAVPKAPAGTVTITMTGNKYSRTTTNLCIKTPTSSATCTITGGNVDSCKSTGNTPCAIE